MPSLPKEWIGSKSGRVHRETKVAVTFSFQRAFEGREAVDFEDTLSKSWSSGGANKGPSSAQTDLKDPADK